MSQDAFSFAAQILERRWSLRVLHTLERKPLRFNEIMKSIPGISTQSLGRVLVAFEEAGLVTRTVDRTRPVRVTYTLHPDLILSGILEGVAEWGAALLERQTHLETTDPPAGPGNPVSRKS